MSRKKKTRKVRRARRTFRDWLSRFWVLGALFVFAFAYGGWISINIPAFRVKQVIVEGVRRLSRAEVARHAAIVTGSNIWLLDTRAIERRIEAVPYVGTAQIHRSLPSTVRIIVAERTPDGCVRTAAGATLTIDSSRRVLERGCAPNALVYLPRGVDDISPGRFLKNPDLARLQKDALALGGSGERFTDFRHDRFGQLEARLPDGIRVRFGDEEDLDRKRRLIGPILAALGGRLSGVRTIDLRAPATPVIEHK